MSLFVRVLVMSVLVLVVACATLRSGALEPVAGIGRIEPVPGGWRVEVPSGIGRFRVQLPAGTVAEISLSYDASRPFPRLEGVQVMGRAGDTVPGVRPDGVNRIRFMAGDTPLDMTVIVIDYYR
ncbi:MAG: hypothetical protein DRR03_08335 [Gammaproteobacteria bacterium]|nr:MAG: hypothetical protein DRR03_08335 [Gammaproteobacteria bacterium]